MVFPYSEDNYPLAPCILKYGDKVFFQEILVDSGADISVIPLNVGLDLGFKLPANKTDLKEFSGFGGSVPVVLKKIDLKIGDYWLENLEIAWALSEEETHLVLGRQGVFDYFDIEFKQKRKVVIFRKAKNKKI